APLHRNTLRSELSGRTGVDGVGAGAGEDRGVARLASSSRECRALNSIRSFAAAARSAVESRFPSSWNSTPLEERMYSTGVAHSTSLVAYIALRASATAASTGRPSTSAA